MNDSTQNLSVAADSALDSLTDLYNELEVLYMYMFLNER